MKSMEEVKELIRTIPDFPKPGIQFRDITTLFLDPEGAKATVKGLCKRLEGVDFDVIAGAEARGFIVGSLIAYEMNKPFVLVRKAGKLPGDTVSETYDLEYGTATIEIHKDALKPGQKVVLADDLLATGGTMKAAANLVEKLGAEVVKTMFIIELPALNGREVLKDYDVETLITFEGD